MNRRRILMPMAAFAVTLFSCNGSASVSSGTSDVPAEHVSVIDDELLDGNYIDWYGRHHHIDDKEYFYYTATGFGISFYGRILDIELHLENRKSDIYYSLAKDGEDLLDASVYVQKGPDTVRVSFDTFDHHHLRLVKRSEPEDGVTSLVRLSTNGYFTEKTETDPVPHFLLIGASGIAGHGALGNPGNPRTTENSSSLHSFGYLASRPFNATFEFVGNSGWGIKYGYNDYSGNTNIPMAYEKTGIDADEKIVDADYHHEKKADIIIVNAGGNDYSAVINKASGFDKEEKVRAFRTQVGNFILKLRSDHPSAHIFWTMTAGSLNGTAASQVISQLDEDDRNHCHIAIIEDVGSGGDAAGADGHASYATHLRSAATLIEAIGEYLPLP